MDNDVILEKVQAIAENMPKVYKAIQEASIPKINSIDILASAWQGDVSPYSQVVTIDGIQNNHRVDLKPTVEQVDEFKTKGIGFTTENDNSVITIYCVGKKPDADYNIQISVISVVHNGEKIIGDTITPPNSIGQSSDNGGEVFNDYNNNIAGSKAFSVTSIDVSTNSLTLDKVDGLDVGHVCSLNSGTNWDFFGSITSIYGTTVYFNKFPKDATLKSGAILWVPEHPELGTKSIGAYTHAEGYCNKASIMGAHVEGGENIAGGKYAHAEGRRNIAGYAAHAEGINNKATGLYSHAEGGGNIATEQYAHAEGYENVATGINSHVEGTKCTASGTNSHAEGESSAAIGTAAHAEGKGNLADGNGAHAEGWTSNAVGHGAHAEGCSNANGDYAHAEGYKTNASVPNSHSEGNGTTASGVASHAEGNSTTASGANSHAEGKNTKATADESHAEGRGTTASGVASHVEGWGSKAIGEGSHAENYSEASGKYSHSNGYGTKAGYDHQTVAGRYNDNKENTLLEIGNGSSSKKSNAFEVYDDGHAEVQTQGNTDNSVVLKKMFLVGTADPSTVNAPVGTFYFQIVE